MEVPDQADELRAWLTRFFRRHEPTQLAVLDTWIDNWKGQEAELKRSLAAFHGVPTSPATYIPPSRTAQSSSAAMLRDIQCLLIPFLAIYAPRRISDVNDIIDSWRGQEEILLGRLKDQALRRDEVLRLLKTQSRADDAVVVLREWFGHECDLISHMNDNDHDNNTAEPDSLPVSQVPLQQTDLASRLRLFYRVYDVEKLGEVDNIVENYSGREDALIRNLRRKYGTAAVMPMLVPSWLTVERREMWLAIFRKWNPALVPQLELTMDGFHGSEEDFLRAVSQLYQPDVKDEKGTAVTAPQLVQTHTPSRPESIPTFAFGAGCNALSLALEAAGLQSYYEVLLGQDIDLATLRKMSDAELASIGVDSASARSTMLNL